MSATKVLFSQVTEAIENVRLQCEGRDDWYRGAQAGASSVGNELALIVRRDNALKARAKSAKAPTQAADQVGEKGNKHE